MNEETFWRTVEAARAAPGDESDAQAQRLVESLSALDVSEIVAFETILRQFHGAAYRADLWGAAYLINGGCSDDGFDYFRAGLIALGRVAYEGALADPDSLADFAAEEIEYEDMMYVAEQAYRRKTGREDFYELVPEQAFPELVGSLDSWSTDGDLDDEKARDLYPRLYAQGG
jgi:hypothetical protein